MSFAPAPDLPLVIRVLMDYRAGLLAREAEQVQDMAAHWLEVEHALEAQIAALSYEIAQMRENGEMVSPGRLMRLERYQNLLSQTNREVARYTTWAEGEITRQQVAWGQIGIQASAEAIEASYSQAGQVAGYFDRLNVGAVETMAGLAGDGSPLASLLQKAYGDAAQEMTNALIRALALGENPRVTARKMRDGLGAGLQRSLVIARTEQMRAYREMGREQYRVSGVVSGYRRVSARDVRVCIACLLSDGEFYPLSVPLDEHPQGRCGQYPVVAGLPVVQWENGKTWYLRQEPDAQQQIMGAGKWEAWQDGAFELGALVKRRENRTWGASLVPTPLRELVGA